jgi:hypothetical protein
MASDTDWTIVPPAALTDGPATGRCRVAEGYAIRGGNQTPRADLADFMLNQLDTLAHFLKLCFCLLGSRHTRQPRDQPIIVQRTNYISKGLDKLIVLRIIYTTYNL